MDLQIAFAVGIFAAAVAVLYVLVTRGTRRGRGEITQAEFDQAKRALEG